jgi:hypothetical protein
MFVPIKVKTFLLVLFALSTGPVLASELYDQWTSARALGMGNAYTAVVDDADSLFYNPAGLARVKGMNITLLDVKAGGDDSKAYSQYKNLESSSSFPSALQGLYGDEISATAAAKTAVAVPYFGFAVYDNVDLDFRPQNPAFTSVDVNAIEDFGYAVGGAFKLGDYVQFGADIKHVRRTGVRENVGPSIIGTLDPTTIKNDTVHEGNGFEADSGINILLPGSAHPVLSATWRNMGVTTYTADTYGETAPPSDNNEVTFGGALTYKLPLLSITPAFDLRYLNRSDVQTSKKINFGVELSFPLIDVRAGFSQGYYTAGAGVNLGIVRLDLVTYEVEIGEYAGQFGDRRYMAQLTIDLDFDIPSGGSGSGSGSGSSGGYRLKQRR